MLSNQFSRILSLAMTMALAGAAHAGFADFYYSNLVTGATPPGSGPYVQLHMEDGAAGTVNFTLSNLFSNSIADQKEIFISELYLNVAGGTSGLTVDTFSPSNKFNGAAGIGNNAFPDASYRFDVDIHFQTNNASGGANRLKAGQSVTFSAHMTGLTVDSFKEFANGSESIYSMVHLQSLPGGQSAKAAAATPEPASLAMIGIGLVSLAKRRRIK